MTIYCYSNNSAAYYTKGLKYWFIENKHRIYSVARAKIDFAVMFSTLNKRKATKLEILYFRLNDLFDRQPLTRPNWYEP